MILKNHFETAPLLSDRCLLVERSIQEGHDLRSGAIRVGAECGVGGSLGDVLLDRPQYRISISSSRHIK